MHPKTLEELHEKFDSRIRSGIFRYTRDIDRVEDIKQEIYVRFMTPTSKNPKKNYLDVYDPDKLDFALYLFLIVRSVTINFLKKEQRRSGHLEFCEDILSEHSVTISEPVFRNIMLSDFLRVLDKHPSFGTPGILREGESVRMLERTYTNIFSLRMVGWNPSEIASLYGVRPNSVHGWLKKIEGLLSKAFNRKSLLVETAT